MKIYIVGCVGSGKSTLARKLSKQHHVTHYELDEIIHLPDGSYRTDQQLEDYFNKLFLLDSWLIEGTYRKEAHCILDQADRIIFLDPPVWLRYYRIFTRFIKQCLHIEASSYRPSFKMLIKMYQWTNSFEKKKPAFIDMLAAYSFTHITSSNDDHLEL